MWYCLCMIGLDSIIDRNRDQPVPGLNEVTVQAPSRIMKQHEAEQFMQSLAFHDAIITIDFSETEAISNHACWAIANAFMNKDRLNFQLRSKNMRVRVAAVFHHFGIDKMFVSDVP